MDSQSQVIGNQQHPGTQCNPAPTEYLKHRSSLKSIGDMPEDSYNGNGGISLVVALGVATTLVEPTMDRNPGGVTNVAMKEERKEM